MVTYAPSRPLKQMRYAMVTPDGALRFEDGTFQEIRQAINGSAQGETGIDYLPRLHPVAAFYFEPFNRPDTRRMNKVANGMYWELSRPLNRAEVDPERDDITDALMDGSKDDRVVKLRGPVTFIVLHERLTMEQQTVLEDVHARVVDRLKDRGWL